ncbi:hypothetical protein NM688_g2356 [Phlebia brevispora]|uniref:Uncharacterized protein n=1 Tax=Phlebia brevispora TaxID=194682 RepID=A0ACC1T8Y7_9APHY|nr:hypothetical protein NM688_g2356 [Phlebia brevispora]
MASPPDNASVLSGHLSSSPKTIRPISEHSHSPVRLRTSTGSDTDLAPKQPRLSPTLSRSYNINDPDMRERQRAMDADMAIQLSRARSQTIVATSPVATSPSQSRLPAEPEEQPFTPLSRQEEQVFDFARGVRHDNDAEEPAETFHPGPAPEAHLNHLSAGHDPSLLVSLAGPEPDEIGGLPMYQPTAPFQEQPPFDFSALESFAREEKRSLGIVSPTTPSPPDGGIPSSHTTTSTVPPLPDSANGVSDFSVPFTMPRTRQRKLSQSVGPRRGKMALFENNNNGPPPSFPFRSPQLAAGMGGTLSAVPSYDNLPDTNVPGGPTLARQATMGTMGSGHDRPYRFSFYSNALNITIHARSLSELPAEGQTFEELFLGINGKEERPEGVNTSRPGTSMGLAGPGARGVPPIPIAERSGLSKLSLGKEAGTGNGSGKPVEASTWWLDVLSPTDEEMKLLSKVFSIHPLTTEDIQMEETREKIELFRNYYLVCFRSFEQDNMSPTYLEPLNMYIIVFREGILSFHFRPTPHPQNVRRRIKQLKDYISVTSDWISYALIDDITDAFGPLIQSIEYEVDSIDELVLILKEAEQSDMLRRIGTCRKKVMGLLRLMGNKADVVKGLAKRCNENWRVAPTSDIGLYLSDIQDHLITMTQNLNHYEKILSRSHSNYLAQISIEMTDANNQINDVLSKLTALGTVLIPMNLVTGLWGMNVHVPGQDVQEGYTWFASIIAVLAAFAVIAGWSTYKLMVGR